MNEAAKNIAVQFDPASTSLLIFSGLTILIVIVFAIIMGIASWKKEDFGDFHWGILFVFGILVFVGVCFTGCQTSGCSESGTYKIGITIKETERLIAENKVLQSKLDLIKAEKQDK